MGLELVRQYTRDKLDGVAVSGLTPLQAFITKPPPNQINTPTLYVGDARLRGQQKLIGGNLPVFEVIYLVDCFLSYSPDSVDPTQAEPFTPLVDAILAVFKRSGLFTPETVTIGTETSTIWQFGLRFEVDYRIPTAPVEQRRANYRARIAPTIVERSRFSA